MCTHHCLITMSFVKPHGHLLSKRHREQSNCIASPHSQMIPSYSEAKNYKSSNMSGELDLILILCCSHAGSWASLCFAFDQFCSRLSSIVASDLLEQPGSVLPLQKISR